MRNKRASRTAIIVAGAAVLGLGGVGTALATVAEPAPVPSTPLDPGAPVDSVPALPLPPCGIPSDDPAGSVPPLPGTPETPGGSIPSLPTLPCWGPAPGVPGTPVDDPTGVILPTLPGIPAGAPGVSANG